MKSKVTKTSLPQNLGTLLGKVRCHAFGTEMRHLQIDFTRPNHEISTALIAQTVSWRESGQFLSKTDADALGISQRRSLLLKVSLTALSQPVWKSSERCLACHEALDLDLPLQDIIDFQVRRESEQALLEFSETQTTARFRRPTGADQRYWAAEGYSAPEDTMIQIISTLQTGGSDLGNLSPETLSKLESAFSDFDPLAAFVLNAQCPACHAPGQFPIDLEALACRQLQKLTSRLIDEVHLLARYYHWSEESIFALPTPRRHAYLARIVKDFQAS